MTAPNTPTNGGASELPQPWDATKGNPTYEQISAQRRADWAAHVAGMTIRPEIRAFAEAMTRKKRNARVSVGHPEAKHEVDWITALLVIRYGEAIHTNTVDPDGKETPFWPQAFSDEDVRRAAAWYDESNEPRYIRYLEPEA